MEKFKSSYAPWQRALSLALISGFFLAGCQQVAGGPTQNSGTDGSDGGVTNSASAVVHTATGNNQIDVLLAINAVNPNAAEQADIKASVQDIIAQLAASGLDYRVGVLSSGTQSSSGWLNTGFGSLLLFQNGQSIFIDPSSPGYDMQWLLQNLFTQMPFESGSAANLKFKDILNMLLPVIITAALQGSKGFSKQAIMNAIYPIIQQAIQANIGHGTQAEIMAVVQKIVDQAYMGGLQSLKFKEIIASLMPIVLAAALKGLNNAHLGQTASLIMPILLRLITDPEHTKIGDVIAAILPIIATQIINGQNNSNQLLQTVMPIVVAYLASKSSKSGKGLLKVLLPVALSIIAGAQDSDSSLNQIITMIMPILLMDFLGSGSASTTATANLLPTLSDPALFSVVNALNHDTVLGNFLRPGAELSVVMVGNSGAQGVNLLGSTTTAQALLAALTLLKNGKQSLVNFNALISGTQSGCNLGGNNGNLYNTITYAAIAQILGGKAADLCGVDALAQSFLQKLTQYKLPQKTSLAGIVEVLVNGLSIPQGDVNGWTLSADGSAIEFHGSFVPGLNATVSFKFIPSAT